MTDREDKGEDKDEDKLYSGPLSRSAVEAAGRRCPYCDARPGDPHDKDCPKASS